MTRYLDKAQHFVTHMFHLTMQLYNASLKRIVNTTQCICNYNLLPSRGCLQEN